jgi:hypothetical protein
MTDAQARLEAWSKQLAAFVAQTDEAAQRLIVQLVEEALLTATRARLQALVDGLPVHRDRILELFASVGITPDSSSADELPATPESILSYYSLIHRDWSWAPEVDEVTPSVEAIAKIVPKDFRLGRTLVLGAGTARLAWDLGHRLPGAEEIVAVDINPLPFLVTERLMRGETLQLFELAGHPRKSTFGCKDLAVAASRPPPPGLRLVLADGLAPPVVPGGFDTVITPWFVDQVPSNAATLPPMIRRVLRAGGSWINHGPFVYPKSTKAAHRYCADEFLELIDQAGFRRTALSYESVPFLASPASSQGRTEWVLTVHTRMLDVANAVSREPAWLGPGSAVAVPLLDGLSTYVAPHPAIAAVAKLIDGERTVTDVTRALVEAGDIADDGTAEVAVRGCLKVLWQALGNA